MKHSKWLWNGVWGCVFPGYILLLYSWYEKIASLKEVFDRLKAFRLMWPPNNMVCVVMWWFSLRLLTFISMEEIPKFNFVWCVWWFGDFQVHGWISNGKTTMKGAYLRKKSPLVCVVIWWFLCKYRGRNHQWCVWWFGDFL